MGLAAQFDGANDFIEVPHSGRLNPGGELTLAAWVRATNTTIQQELVGKSTTGDGYALGIQAGKLFPQIWDTSGALYSAQWGSISPGVWTHLAVTWESGGDMVGYVNGSEVGRIAASANAIKANTNPLRVGVAPWNTSAFPANGRLDHITLFTRALTSPEIRAMYLVQGAWVEERRSAAVTVDSDAPGWPWSRTKPTGRPRCGAARQGF